MQYSLLLGEYCVMLTLSYFSQLFMKHIGYQYLPSICQADSSDFPTLT